MMKLFKLPSKKTSRRLLAFILLVLGIIAGIRKLSAADSTPIEFKADITAHIHLKK